MASEASNMPRKLWQHPDPTSTPLYKFLQDVNRKRNYTFRSFSDLYEWSVGDCRLEFWNDVLDHSGLIYEGNYTRPVDPHARMDSQARWFDGLRLNWAENMLYDASPTDPSVRSTSRKPDDKVAVTEVREGSSSIVHVTWKELRERVARLSNVMRARGLRKGDRIAVVASNSCATLCIFLAAASVGALFSSSSPDMGTKGVLDRLLQIKPKWIFCDDAALYNGKIIDLREKMHDIVVGMKNIEDFEVLISMKRFDRSKDVRRISETMTMKEFLEFKNVDGEMSFTRVGFNDPFVIVYSSGTTGMPKCIVHSVGGVLMVAINEGKLQRGLDEHVVGLQYSTTGWIMYLTAVGYLIHGGRSILYDGSPFQPDLEALIKLVSDQQVTHLGISPRYLQELQKNGIAPQQVADLSKLRVVTSTGMVLSEALFEWIYDVGFPKQIQLANISGGTDLAGCFGMENALTPLYMGGCQGPTLGIKIEVYDQTIEGGEGVQGKRVSDGQPGELVATRTFPNQPIFFFGDPTGEKYFNAYYARFDNVWVHRDYIQGDSRTGQLTWLGRADGVLNPSGIRFGSAEIYNVVDQFFSSRVQDSLCVGQRRPQDPDETVMLFLLMKPGQRFGPLLAGEIKDRIASALSKRHVPRYVFETPEIPTTINGKKVELPVKRIVSGEAVKPSDTLANKACLTYYYKFVEVEKLVNTRSKI